MCMFGGAMRQSGHEAVRRLAICYNTFLDAVVRVAFPLVLLLGQVAVAGRVQVEVQQGGAERHGTRAAASVDNQR